MSGAQVATGRITLTLVLPDPLMTINWRRRQSSWRAAQRETKRQRRDAGWQIAGEARGVTFPASRRVCVDLIVRPRRGMRRHDDSAIWEAMKPVFDALEDAKVVRDDKQLIHGALIWSEERTGEVVVTLTEVS